MKLNIMVAAGAMALVVAALSAFVAYNYLYACIDMPDMGLYIGKTIDTSELCHPEQFTWYTYNETENHAVIGEPTYDRQITFDYSDVLYNGSISKHCRQAHTYFNRSGANLTQIVDTYWDISGTTCTGSLIRELVNGTVVYRIDRNYSDYSRMGPYKKSVFILPSGGYIAPRGAEKVTIGGVTYDCQKYYLPDQKHGNTVEIAQHTYWFADGIPVPVKVHLRQDVTFELAGWG